MKIKSIFKLIDVLKGKYYRHYYRYRGINIGTGTRLDIKTTYLNGKDIQIGEYCYVGPFGYLNGVGGIEIKSGTLIGPYTKILSGTHNFRSSLAIPYDHTVIKGKVSIDENVWIGANVTILPGVRIGEGAIIGACSVVTKDVAPYSINVGNPSKIIGYRDENQYRTLKQKGAVYLKIKNELVK